MKTVSQREFILRLVYCATLLIVVAICAVADVQLTKIKAEQQVEVEDTRPRKVWEKEPSK